MKTLLEKVTRTDSEAKKQAKALGLKYHGFGYWGTKERVTHKTSNGRLYALPTSKTFDVPLRFKYDNSKYNAYMSSIPATTNAEFHKYRSGLLRWQLSDEEHKEILKYLNSSSGLNGFLSEPAYRKSLYKLPGKVEELQKRVDTMDAIMKKSTLEDDVTLYRGVFGTSAQEFIKKALADEEEIINTPCYLSTSMSPGVAHGFEDYNNPIMMIIKAKRGQNALTVTPELLKIPSETTDDERGYYKDVSEKEHEVILPRNTRLRIVRVEERSKTSKEITHRPKEVKKVIRIIMEIV